MKNFLRHLWYLSSELFPLALFSDKIDAQEKSETVKAMKEREVGKKEPRKLSLPEEKVPENLDRNLSYFANKNSQHFFFVLRYSILIFR